MKAFILKNTEEIIAGTVLTLLVGVIVFIIITQATSPYFQAN